MRVSRSLLARLLGVGWLPNFAADIVVPLLRRTDASLERSPTTLLRRLAASDDAAQRAIVSGAPRDSVTSAAVLAAVDAPEAIGPAALLFDKVAASPGERSRVLHQAIVLDSASFPLRQHTALLCVRRHADEITGNHATAILERCLSLGLQPVDPYNPAPAGMAARTAAAALVARNPALDERVLARIKSPEAALVQAAALQARPARFGDSVAAALKAMHPDERRAIGFARDCDRQFSAVDSIEPNPRTLDLVRGAIVRVARRASITLRTPLRGLAAVALVTAFAGGAIAIDAWLVDLPDSVTVMPGEALAALGILVAVHVLSAELSANRLAGPIARVTSFPITLQSGYLAGLSLLVLGTLKPRHSDLATFSAATLGVISSLVLLVIAALISLLRRTDPVRAVDAFARRQRAAVIAAGRSLGRLQSKALRQRELLFGFAWARSTFAPPLGERRVKVSAQRSGYLLLRERRLRRLARRPEYQEEQLRLAAVSVIGVPVSSGDEVFSVVPATDVPPKPADIARVHRLIRIRERRRIDQVAEYVGTLLGISVAQAQAGNVAGAERVRSAALLIVEMHLDAVRLSRATVPAGDPVGLVPALRTAAVQGVRALGSANDANSREIVLGFLQRLLVRTDAADSFCATLATQLGLSGEGMHRPNTQQLLWDCGVRALELDDQLGLFQVRGQIERLLPKDIGSVELGGRLVQYAALARPMRAEQLWHWHETRCGDHERFSLTAMRIGASALTVGDASLALLVALRMRAENADAWAQYFGEDEAAAAESLADDLYGQLLGADAQSALQDFVRFADSASSTQA